VTSPYKKFEISTSMRSFLSQGVCPMNRRERLMLTMEVKASRSIKASEPARLRQYLIDENSVIDGTNFYDTRNK
jgi:hypothetical protein